MTGASLRQNFHQQLANRLKESQARAVQHIPILSEGRLVRMVGLTLEVEGCEVPVGGRCLVGDRAETAIEAEVVGFSGDHLYLMPVGQVHGLMPGSRVVPTNQTYQVGVGDGLLGRVIDGSGKPLDGKGSYNPQQFLPITGQYINPLERPVIDEQLDVGVRSINGLLSVGQGQRMGLFAGSGVGKSVLLGMMTRYTEAEITVVGLIGERGREVSEFVEKTLGEEGMKRAVVVAAPADAPPLMRLHGAYLATTIAEYFRDQGKNVLLLMDSLTRFAQAQREISLAVGEPPATRGYTPSVFARLPQLVERAGKTNKGSITGFYTVLAEGDDQNDPIADAARAILDGHIVLNRSIAESGVYPAIDIEASISRVMDDVVDVQQVKQARKFKQIYSTYQSNHDLISVGAYQAGSDPKIDEAIQAYPALQEFMQQDMRERVEESRAREELGHLIGE
ncbi:MAG: flagellar protein export ATPase FliI [bacterium]